MKYRCDDCNEHHDTSDLTINIGDEGYKVIDDINEAVMDIVEKRKVPYELLPLTFRPASSLGAQIQTS